MARSAKPKAVKAVKKVKKTGRPKGAGKASPKGTFFKVGVTYNFSFDDDTSFCRGTLHGINDKELFIKHEEGTTIFSRDKLVSAELFNEESE